MFYFYEKNISILIGITLNVETTLVSMDISTVFILSVHNYLCLLSTNKLEEI